MRSARNLDEAQFHTQFLTESDRIAEIAAGYGYTITPYRNDSLLHFSKLRFTKKRNVVESLVLQREFLESAAGEGLPIHSPQLIWRALVKLNLAPSHDSFSRLTEDHTVEIYLKDGTSCFKNLNYFRHITLSLEEIFCLPFSKIARFSLPGYLYFAELLIRFNSGQLRRTFRPRFNRYILQEKCGLKKKLWLELLFCSPLRRLGRTEAMMFVNVHGLANSADKVGEMKSLQTLP